MPCNDDHAYAGHIPADVRPIIVETVDGNCYITLDKLRAEIRNGSERAAQRDATRRKMHKLMWDEVQG